MTIGEGEMESKTKVRRLKGMESKEIQCKWMERKTIEYKKIECKDDSKRVESKGLKDYRMQNDSKTNTKTMQSNVM